MSNRAITQNGTNTGGLLEGQSMLQCRYDRSNTTIIRPHGKLQIFVLGVPGTRVLSSNTSILTFSKVPEMHGEAETEMLTTPVRTFLSESPLDLYSPQTRITNSSLST